MTVEEITNIFRGLDDALAEAGLSDEKRGAVGRDLACRLNVSQADCSTMAVNVNLAEPTNQTPRSAELNAERVGRTGPRDLRPDEVREVGRLTGGFIDRFETPMAHAIDTAQRLADGSVSASIGHDLTDTDEAEVLRISTPRDVRRAGDRRSHPRMR